MISAYVTSLRVVDLRNELKNLHLPYVGNKKVLAQRLRTELEKREELEKQEKIYKLFL